MESRDLEANGTRDILGLEGEFEWRKVVLGEVELEDGKVWWTGSTHNGRLQDFFGGGILANQRLWAVLCQALVSLPLLGDICTYMVGIWVLRYVGDIPLHVCRRAVIFEFYKIHKCKMK